MNPIAGEVRELIQKLTACVDSSGRVTCSGFDVTPLQCQVLMEVRKDQPLAMQPLANRLHLAVSTVTRVVDKLVARNLLLRSAGEEDRRMVLLTLTKAGQQSIDQLIRDYDSFFDRLVKRIPAEHLPGFITGLRVMVREVQECCGSSFCECLTDIEDGS